MKYYFLQIKEGPGPFFDCVDKWISQHKFAAVFSRNTINDFLSKKKDSSKDLQRFVEVFSKEKEESFLVSIGSKIIGKERSDYLYIYKKDGPLKEYDGELSQYKVNPNFYKNRKIDNVIGFPINLLVELPIVKCPLVLATLKSNQYLSRGTFKELRKKSSKSDPKSEFNSYFGNRKAIEYLVKNEKVEVDNFEQYLECLSSIEFETLIAKLKEEQGFFVPAYKGGSFKDYDILCFKNDKEEYIQAKLNLSKDTFKEYKDIANLHIYCVHCEVDKTNYPNIFNFQDIQSQLENCENTKNWLEQSLRWVEIK